MGAKKVTLLRSALRARARSRKGLLAQATEIVGLFLAPGRVSPSEYYDFGLYDDTRFSWDDKRRFLGWRGADILDRLNRPIWHALANDKLAFYGLMKGVGIAIPKLYAIYHRGHRSFGDAPSFSCRDELAAFMRQQMPYPCFGKPVHGVYGRGAVLIRDYDSSTDKLQLGTGEEIDMSDFVHQIPDPSGLGYLFQAVLKSAKEVHALCGDRLSTVRVMVLLAADGPRFFPPEWKIPTGNNMVDNYLEGELGNLIAEVDLESERVYELFGADDQRLENHPDTGQRLLDVKMPQWNEIQALVRQAALALPGLLLQGWDIALTTQGPVPLEVNLVTARSLYDVQIKFQRGILDDEILALSGRR